MQQTSLIAYGELQNLSQKRAHVYSLIKSHEGLCLFELSKLTGWAVNRITGRVNELVKMGLVEDSGERRMNLESKKSAIVWKIKGE